MFLLILIYVIAAIAIVYILTTGYDPDEELISILNSKKQKENNTIL